MGNYPEALEVRLMLVGKSWISGAKTTHKKFVFSSSISIQIIHITSVREKKGQTANLRKISDRQKSKNVFHLTGLYLLSTADTLFYLPKLYFIAGG